MKDLSFFVRCFYSCRVLVLLSVILAKPQSFRSGGSFSTKPSGIAFQIRYITTPTSYLVQGEPPKSTSQALRLQRHVFYNLQAERSLLYSFHFSHPTNLRFYMEPVSPVWYMKTAVGRFSVPIYTSNWLVYAGLEYRSRLRNIMIIFII